MGDPIQSFLATYGQGDPETRSLEARARCCCGSEACAVLKHNQSALDGLEKDVSTAARLGKALLIRHETYIADSERERKKMALQIETLEVEKQVLERKNTATIQENRILLDQLESLNTAVIESDAQVMRLQETLHSTNEELAQLQTLAARTESLERQLADFEREQLLWQTSLDSKEQSEKSAVRRWQHAERTLADLQDQMERIERESRDERQRHGEIVDRMERRYAVERELGSAAGRLKGAAALKSSGGDTGGTNVVSHFVKDILQDNANLQTGIVELREMLTTSNEEVEKLRSQLTLHQPMEQDGEAVSTTLKRTDLKSELGRANSQELHVHHHYHAPANAQKTLRKKKRVLVPGHYTPPSGLGTPRSSFSQHNTATPLATILQQTSASIPQQIPEGKRWSTQSNTTYASLASSPQSTINRTSSLYERVFSDAGHDSRPSTPGTEDLGSPALGPSHYRKPSAGSFRGYSAPSVQRRSFGLQDPDSLTLDSILRIDEFQRNDIQHRDSNTIPEESETDWDSAIHADVTQDDAHVSGQNLDDILDAEFQPQQPSLRRTTSHESVFSIAAMDIHTLKSRPSQLLTTYGGRGNTSDAVISDTTVHAARPSAMSRTSTDSRMLLSGMALESRTSNSNSARPTLGRKVGDWVFGKWGGAAPVHISVNPTSPDSARSPRAASISSASIKSGDDVQTIRNKPRIRSPGINQPGPILGFGPEVKVQYPPVVKGLDEDALRKALGND